MLTPVIAWDVVASALVKAVWMVVVGVVLYIAWPKEVSSAIAGFLLVREVCRWIELRTEAARQARSKSLALHAGAVAVGQGEGWRTSLHIDPPRNVVPFKRIR